MRELLKNWDFMRFVRLILGLVIGINGIYSKDYVLLMFSAFFLFQAILNISCCGAQGCGTSNDKTQKKGLYENEVKPFKP